MSDYGTVIANLQQLFSGIAATIKTQLGSNTKIKPADFSAKIIDACNLKYNAGKTDYNPTSATLGNDGSLVVKNAAGTNRMTKTFLNNYNQGVYDADARVNTSSASYVRGNSDGYARGNSDGYASGYNNGYSSGYGDSFDNLSVYEHHYYHIYQHDDPTNWSNENMKKSVQVRALRACNLQIALNGTSIDGNGGHLKPPSFEILLNGARLAGDTGTDSYVSYNVNLSLKPNDNLTINVVTHSLRKEYGYNDYTWHHQGMINIVSHKGDLNEPVVTNTFI